MPLPRVAILLPTWNGEKYLHEQVDSLLAQDYPDFIIVSRDDGSRDSSPAIIADYAARFPQRFHIVPADGRNLGASGSFALLMAYALQEKAALGLGSAWVLPSDQDDVWHADKLRTSMTRMLELEGRYPGQPLLVHGDLEVVDEAMCQMAPSFVRYQGLKPLRNSFGRLLVSNTVTGCTALCNEALLMRALPVPAQAVMHDWWLALVAGAFGRLSYIDAPLLQYRQHGANTIGAKEYKQPPLLKGFWQRLRDDRHRSLLQGLAAQAQAFHAAHARALSVAQRLDLRMAMALASHSLLVRKLALKFFLSR
jgi:glycosyltransferase involved in cell wall biosynthesis